MTQQYKLNEHTSNSVGMWKRNQKTQVNCERILTFLNSPETITNSELSSIVNSKLIEFTNSESTKATNLESTEVNNLELTEVTNSKFVEVTNSKSIETTNSKFAEITNSKFLSIVNSKFADFTYPELPIVTNKLKTFSDFSGTLPNKLKTFSDFSGTLPNKLDVIFLYVFEKLDMRSTEAVAATCKRSRSICESNLTLFIHIKYEALNKQRVGNLGHQLRLLCLHLGLLLRLKFNPEVKTGEINGSPGYYRKAHLWIQERRVTDKALKEFYKSLLECRDASILLIQGDSLFFPHELPFEEICNSRCPWKYLCISGGTLSVDWSIFINRIGGLQRVYFKPGSGSYKNKVIWTINIPNLLFIMDSVMIKQKTGIIE
jgi:hypothetical protein